MDLQAQVLRVDRHIQRIALPESQEWISKNEPIEQWNAKQRGRVAMALEDGNEALLQEALGALVNGQERLNTLIAESLRAQHPSPDEWPLGHFKWMKIIYVHLTSPFGEFLLYPRTPRFPRQGFRWYTADELIDMYSSPVVIESIKIFGVLPTRADALALDRPPRDENDLHLDFTVEPHTIKALRGNLVNRRRW